MLDYCFAVCVWLLYDVHLQDVREVFGSIRFV